VRKEKLYSDPYLDNPCFEEDQCVGENISLPSEEESSPKTKVVFDPIPDEMSSVCNPTEAKCIDYPNAEEHSNLQSIPPEKKEPHPYDGLENKYNFEESPDTFIAYRYQSHAIQDFAPFNHFAKRFDPTPNDGQKGKSRFTYEDFIQAQEQLWSEAYDPYFPNHALKAALLRGKDSSPYGRNDAHNENISYSHFIDYIKTQECYYLHHKPHHVDIAPYYYSIDPNKTKDFPYNAYANKFHPHAKEDPTLPAYLRGHIRFISFEDFAGTGKRDFGDEQHLITYSGGLIEKLIAQATINQDQELLKALTPDEKVHEFRMKKAFEQFKAYLKNKEDSYLKKYTKNLQKTITKTDNKLTPAWTEGYLYHPQTKAELPTSIDPDNFTIDDYRKHLPALTEVAVNQNNGALATALENYETFIEYIREYRKDPLATLHHLYHLYHQSQSTRNLSHYQIDPITDTGNVSTTSRTEGLYHLENTSSVDRIPSSEEVTQVFSDEEEKSRMSIETNPASKDEEKKSFRDRILEESKTISLPQNFSSPYYEGGYSEDPWYYYYDLNILRNSSFEKIIGEVYAAKGTLTIDLLDYILLKPALREAAIASSDNRFRQVMEEGDFQDFKQWLELRVSDDYPVQDLPDKKSRFSGKMAITYQNYGFAYRKVEEEVRFHKEIPAQAFFKGSSLNPRENLKLVDLDLIRIKVQEKTTSYSADQNNAKIVVRSKITGDLRVFILNKPVYVTHLIEFKRIPGMEMQMYFHPFDEFDIIEFYSSDGEIILPLNNDVENGTITLNLDPRNISIFERNQGEAVSQSNYADSYQNLYGSLAADIDPLSLIRRHRSFYEAVLENNEHNEKLVGHGGIYLAYCIKKIIFANYDELIKRIEKEDPDTNIDVSDLKLIAQKKIIDIFKAALEQEPLSRREHVEIMIKYLHEENVIIYNLLHFMKGPYHTELLILLAKLGLRQEVGIDPSIPLTGRKKQALIGTGLIRTGSDLWKAVVNFEELIPGIGILIGQSYHSAMGGVNEEGYAVNNPIGELMKLYYHHLGEVQTAEKLLGAKGMSNYDQTRFWGEFGLEALGGGVAGGTTVKKVGAWFLEKWKSKSFRTKVLGGFFFQGASWAYGMARPEYEEKRGLINARVNFSKSVERARQWEIDNRLKETSLQNQESRFQMYGYGYEDMVDHLRDQVSKAVSINLPAINSANITALAPSDITRGIRHFMGHKTLPYNQVSYCIDDLVNSEDMGFFDSVVKGFDWITDFGDYDHCESFAIKGLEIYQLEEGNRDLFNFISLYTERYYQLKSQGWKKDEIISALENIYAGDPEHEILIKLLCNQAPLKRANNPETKTRLENHYKMMEAIGLLKTPDSKNFRIPIDMDRFVDYLQAQYRRKHAIKLLGTKSK
jgi:hypothetical protein